MHLYDELEELCGILSDELGEVVDKVHGGKMSSGDLEYIDKLTHALKSVTILKSMEDDSYDGSYDGSYEGRSHEGNSGRRSYDYSGRRRRDSMGRYSRDKGTIRDLEVLAEHADPQTKMEIEAIVNRMR